MHKKKLIIHIGTNKTGTSAIQKFFNDNRSELSSYGLLYPKTGCKGVAHYELSRLLGFNHQHRSFSDDILANIKNQLNVEFSDSGCDHLLISSEDFVLPRKILKVHEFFSDFDCWILVYLRRHDHWWVSAYNQAVRMVTKPPYQRGFDAFLRYNRRRNPKYGDYLALLERWAKVFSKDRIIVRPFEREQNRPNIIADFLEVLCIKHNLIDNAALNSDRINPSIDAQSLFLLEIIQRIDCDDKLRHRIIDFILDKSESNCEEHIISPMQRLDLITRNLPHYETIARDFLGRENGRLFYEPLPDLNEEWRKPKYPSIVEVAEKISYIVSELMQRNL